MRCVAQPPRSTPRNEFIMSIKVSNIKERATTRKGAPGNYHNRQSAALPTSSATSAPQQKTSFSLPYEPPTDSEGGTPKPQAGIKLHPQEYISLGTGKKDSCFSARAKISAEQFGLAMIRRD